MKHKIGMWLAMLGVTLGLLALGLVVWRIRYCADGPGMVAPFTKVTRFTREQEFAASYFGHLEFVNDILPSRGKLVLYDFAGAHGVQWLAVSGTGASFYILEDNYKEITEYDMTGKKLQTIAFEDCGLDPNTWAPHGIIGLCDSTVYVSMGRKETINLKRIKLTWDTVVAFSFNGQSFSYKKYTVEANMGVDMDGSCSKFYILDARRTNRKESLVHVYDVSTESITRTIAFPGFVLGSDYADGLGLVMSKGWYDDEAFIFLVNPDTGEVRKMTDGTYATWGADGYIYFLRGYGQLWRQDPNKTVSEPVCLLTEKPRPSKPFWVPLWPGRNRSFLIFNYSVPRFAGGDNVGRVLLDLQQEEYKEIPKGTRIKGVWRSP